MARTWTITVGDVIDQARVIVNDNDPDGYRQEDTQIMKWLDGAMATLVSVLPGQFMEPVSHTCSAGYRQTIEAERAVALHEIVGIPPGDMATLSSFIPLWRSADKAAAKNWMRPTGEEPLTFYLYPPAPSGQVLDLIIVRQPAPFTARSNTVQLPENLLPALVDYVVSMIEYQDDEHVNSGRQAAAMSQFAARVSGAAPGSQRQPQERGR